jgi:lysophospholipase L1-like esterase
MPRAIQATYTKANTKRIACIGDSYSWNYTLGVPSIYFWPAKLQTKLNAAGARVLCRNFGISGNTTGQMLARVACMTQIDVPDIGIVYGGTNDLQYASTVQASPTPTSTVFAVASGFGTNYKAGTYLTVGGVSAKILSVATDTITLTAPLTGGAPAAGTAVAIDTQTNLTVIGQTVAAAQAAAGKQPRIIVSGQHYMNFSTGGDTHSTPTASGVTLRGLQSAAATAVNGYVTGSFTTQCVFVNHWSFMDGLIQNSTPVDGVTFTQGDFKWHVLDQNTHPSAIGGSVLGQSYYTSIVAQSGWLSALS